MIVWLASYPRSGNTLFRTICRRCFGLCSHADEPVEYASEFRSNPDLIGHCEVSGDWDAFYRQASLSPDIHLVKTHRPPVDEQPYIYIVRDGRSAVLSFQKFNRTYNHQDFSLTSLILGAGGYGGWSEHYQRWNGRDGIRRRVLRYEDLADISAETLKQVAEFIGFDGPVAEWENPVETLKKKEPGFFGGQHRRFAGDERWTVSHEYLFAKIHGDLMVRLGYYEKGYAADFPLDIPAHTGSVWSEMISHADDLAAENRLLRRTCDERLALINELIKECEERLRLINTLHDHLNNPGKR